MVDFKVLLKADLLKIVRWLSILNLKTWVYFSQLLVTITYFSIAGWLLPPKKKFPMASDRQKIIFSETFEWLTFARVLYACMYESWGPKSWNWVVLVMGLYLWMAPWEGSSREIHRPVQCWVSSLFWCLLRVQPHTDNCNSVQCFL